MGGYGALSYAARHPGTFLAAASFSGALEIGSEEAWAAERDAARWRAHLAANAAAIDASRRRQGAFDVADMSHHP